MSVLEMRVLDRGEMERLHQATLQVFENPGVRIPNPAILAKLAAAGALVDEVNQIVRFPREMVAERLAVAPPVARMTGLNGKILETGSGNRYYHSLILDPWITDFEHGPRRPVLEDVRRHTILGDALDRVSGMMRMQYPVADMPEPQCYWKTMEIFLCHTTKHVAMYPTDLANALDWIGAGEILAGSAGLKKTPLYTVAVAISSPLTLNPVNGDLLELAIEYNQPVISTVCPMAGSTSPYTLAGTMLISNAEALLPVIVAQVLAPGHPVLYAIGPSVTDLRSGHDLYYKAEKTLFKLMGVQMGRFYNLPVAGETAGATTWRLDVQNGAEGMLYLLAAVAAGQHMFGGLGSNYNAVGMSAEQILLQCGMVDQAEYVARGVSLDDHQLGLESIRAAGPGGHYLADDLTIEYMRSDQFFRTPHFDYAGDHRPSAGASAMAHEKVEEIVRSHKPAVPDSVQQELMTYFGRKIESV
ncbi:MAG: trimethylamine methyltransferase family protein [Bryobacteraceae bacterium]